MKCLLIGVLCVAAAFQLPGAERPAASLQTEVHRIEDRRSADGRLTVTLKFQGEAVKNAFGVLRVQAHRALDDQGNNLVLAGSETPSPGWSSAGGSGGGPGFSPVHYGVFNELRTTPRFGSVALRSPARTARAIRTLAGDIELYSPGYANGGVVVLKDFTTHPGEVLRDPTLEKLGIQLTYLTKASYPAAEYLQFGTNPPTRSVNTQFESKSDALFTDLPDADRAPRNRIVLKVSDSDKKVAGFAFQAPDGRLLPVPQQRTVNDLRAFYFNTLTSDNLALFVYLIVPAAVTTLPFEVSDVPLP